MIRHLLEENKIIVLVLLAFFSCKKQETESVREYSYPRVIINDNLKREIFSYKEDLNKIQATESSNLSLCFVRRNDSVFVEIGDYKPNLKMLNIKGVEIIKKDTVYLFSENNSTDIERFYKNQSDEKVNIRDNIEPTLDHYDPHFRCLYVDNESFKILSYNNKCR